VEEPGSYLESHASGAVGVGLPFAIGAALARPGVPIAAFLGDTSAAMHALEMETVVRERLPVLLVVNNDRGMGMLREAARIAFGEADVPWARMGPVRYDLVAEAVGAQGVWVEDPADLGPSLDLAVLSRAPTCANVATDPRVHSPLAEALGHGAGPG
jgi:acetolactate synthase-1/2/3 large subunit